MLPDSRPIIIIVVVFFQWMEDCKMVSADCIVICTCCPCLIIQFMAFLLLRLPCKIAKKTKKLIWKKIRAKSTGNLRGLKRILSRREEEGSVLEAQIGEGLLVCSDFQCPIEEVEKVMKELYECGELGFGFFGRKRSGKHDSIPVANGGDGSCVWEIIRLEQKRNFDTKNLDSLGNR